MVSCGGEVWSLEGQDCTFGFYLFLNHVNLLSIQKTSNEYGEINVNYLLSLVLTPHVSKVVFVLM